jgi:hypothetical protein
MGSSMTSRGPTPPISPIAAGPAGDPAPRRATPRELATQTPHLIGYSLQQFVHLAGAQCRMSPAEVAYHNREHDRAKGQLASRQNRRGALTGLSAKLAYGNASARNFNSCD